LDDFRIRVLVSELPEMLSQIMSQIVQDQEDIEFLGSGSSIRELPEVIRKDCPDVVILGATDHDLERIGRTVLMEQRHLRLINIEGDGKSACIWELQPVRLPLGEASSKSILTAIRGVRTR
jgi:chemotaxis response regulator CheB